MKKKIVALLLTAVMAFSLAACGENPAAGGDSGKTEDSDGGADSGEGTTADSGDSSSGYELALVTDAGTIDDKSFNQGAWEGLEAYGSENGISYKYYQPTEKTTTAYVETIELAIEGGAKLVVTPGFLFAEAIFIVQEQFPDTMFILIDSEPKNPVEGEEAYIKDNVMCISYQEDEAGFLAGYAAVKDGYTSLGFMGGMATPPVVRFGYGYIQGVEYAAKELGLDSVDLTYHYTGAFAATPEAQTQAASWYDAGTEVIFGCGGAVGNSVMSAAEAAGAKVIGVDIDQSGESDTVITSAMKGLKTSVYDGIEMFYAGEFPGGHGTVFAADNEGVALPMDSSKFESFSEDDYQEIFDKLANKEITIENDSTVKIDKIEDALEIVKLKVIE